MAVGPFRLVYLVFNSLLAALSQARQIDCFRNVARALDPGGVFVIECFVPGKARSGQSQRITSELDPMAAHAGPAAGRVRLSASRLLLFLPQLAVVP
jgi:hypothetical protein